MSNRKAKQSTGRGAVRRIVLFGNAAEVLLPIVEEYSGLIVVDRAPDIVVCYGGDGTLLAAELQWPGVPKAPILNSRRGHRCIPKSPREVIAALSSDQLVHNAYTKLECAVRPARQCESDFVLTCLNEISVHMGRINSAVRFKLWLNDAPFDGGVELISDGFVACTAFGSTAYFKAITKGFFTEGIGLAFKATTYPVNHVVLPEETVVRFEITRGPATLAFDNSTEYLKLSRGDCLTIRKHAQSADILTCEPVARLDEPF